MVERGVVGTPDQWGKAVLQGGEGVPGGMFEPEVIQGVRKVLGANGIIYGEPSWTGVRGDVTIREVVECVLE